MKKLSLYVFLGLLWCNVSFAECIKGNCTNGQGTSTWANGNKHVGEYKDGKRHGQGTYTFANGDKYVGEYKEKNPPEEVDIQKLLLQMKKRQITHCVWL